MALTDGDRDLVRRLERELARRGVAPETYAREILVDAERLRFKADSAVLRADFDPLHETDFLVEANDFERHQLWSMWSREAPQDARDGYARNRMAWRQETGWAAEVEEITRPGHAEASSVVASLVFDILDGHRVAFFYGCSTLVDHLAIERFLAARCRPTIPSSEDANNFHVVAHEIERRGHGTRTPRHAEAWTGRRWYRPI